MKKISFIIIAIFFGILGIVFALVNMPLVSVLCTIGVIVAVLIGVNKKIKPKSPEEVVKDDIKIIDKIINHK